MRRLSKTQMGRLVISGTNTTWELEGFDSLNGKSSAFQVSFDSQMPPGFVGNFKSASTLMFCLYLAMEEHASDNITQEEIMIASGQKVLDPGEASKFLDELESMNGNIQHAFEKQAETAAVHEYPYILMVMLMVLRAHGTRKSLKICW
jgi:hypothetical protein